jgi:SAM-dependent methyltransferase
VLYSQLLTHLTWYVIVTGGNRADPSHRSIDATRCLAPGSFDLIVSNCVLNLCTDKGAVLDNAHALLKPGNDTAAALLLERTCTVQSSARGNYYCSDHGRPIMLTLHY